MVLENARFVLGPERSGDVFAFLWSKDDTAIVGVNTQVVVEEAPVLLKDVNRTSEDGPSFAVEGVAVGCCNNLWTGIVNCRV